MKTILRRFCFSTGRKRKILLAIVMVMIITMAGNLFARKRSDLRTLSLIPVLLDGTQTIHNLVKIYNRHLIGQLHHEDFKEADPNVYQERNIHLQKKCKMIQATLDKVRGSSLSQMWTIHNPPIFFCPAYKAGTTFWAKVLHVLRLNTADLVSPFHVFDTFGLQQNLTLLSQHFATFPSVPTIFLEKFMKFLFVRDPYQRLFSVYVDKVLAPNNYFVQYGSKLKQNLRNDSKHDDHLCGTEMTFSEFVTAIFDANGIEKHLLPMHRLCHVCHINYDIIGKFETFQQDVGQVLKNTGTLNQRLIFKNLDYEKRLDILLYQIIRAYKLEKNWGKCLTKHSAWKRLWRQLQISGFVNKEITYQLSEEESEHIAMTDYINMAINAFKASDSRAKLNKHEAFLQAYSQLSKSQLSRLRLLYLKDFWLFDYEDRPDELFKRQKPAHVDFDYFDILRE